ncbi:MAG: hypothetical protein HZB51_27320 [Chloroflexi bacterium]|nr:hypothetical protein [Chloroflexota bacterium]
MNQKNATTTIVAATLAPLAKTPQSQLNTFELIDRAWLNGDIDIEHATLYKVWALFGAKYDLPPQYFSQVPVHGDGTGLFLYAVEGWELLSPPTRKTVNDFITPHEYTTTLPSELGTTTPKVMIPPGRYVSTITSEDYPKTQLAINGRWDMDVRSLLNEFVVDEMSRTELRGRIQLSVNHKLVLTQSYNLGNTQILIKDEFGS